MELGQYKDNPELEGELFQGVVQSFEQFFLQKVRHGIFLAGRLKGLGQGAFLFSLDFIQAFVAGNLEKPGGKFPPLFMEGTQVVESRQKNLLDKFLHPGPVPYKTTRQNKEGLLKGRDNGGKGPGVSSLYPVDGFLNSVVLHYAVYPHAFPGRRFRLSSRHWPSGENGVPVVGIHSPFSSAIQLRSGKVPFFLQIPDRK
jgi:hypothetical protein